MNGKGKGFTKNEIRGKVAPWALRMVDDACAPPDVIVLAGYLGPSSRKGEWWRLYLTMELNHFVDIRADDIVYVEDAGDQTLSGVAVWVRKDAKLWHMFIASEHVEAQHLRQGDLARRYLPRVSSSFQLPGGLSESEQPQPGPSVVRMC